MTSVPWLETNIWLSDIAIPLGPIKLRPKSADIVVLTNCTIWGFRETPDAEIESNDFISSGCGSVLLVSSLYRLDKVWLLVVKNMKLESIFFPVVIPVTLLPTESKASLIPLSHLILIIFDLSSSAFRPKTCVAFTAISFRLEKRSLALNAGKRVVPSTA